MKLLDNILVLECSYCLTCSNIGLRLAQLGAKVIRVVDSVVGDALEHTSIYGQFYDDRSLLYYSKTVGKSELLIDPQSEADLALFNSYLERADVVVYDYNENVFEGFGVDVKNLRRRYPRLVEAEFSAYGSHTLYGNKVADDLIIQAFSGITWLTGDRDDAPTPMGFKVTSQFCSTYLTQAIMAALYSREINGGALGGKVSTSLLEAVMLVQLEVITTSANSGMVMPIRAKRGNAHAGLPAPYGVYQSKDGFFAMSFVSITLLTDIMGLEIPDSWRVRESWLWYRDEIMEFLRPHFLEKSNCEWLDLFTPHDVWCSDINDLSKALELEAYKLLELERVEPLPHGGCFTTIGLPYQIDTNSSVDRVVESRSEQNSVKPYDALLALDISQYLSGPTSTLQLADFGATVVKIERPQGGDMGRNVIISNLLLDDTSSSFLAVGRNKRSAAFDLKNEDDIVKVKELMSRADVIVQNFRPSVMQRLGLDYDTIRRVNPSVIYAEISGYGDKGCWARKPGQDYIVQALSGLCMLSGKRGDEPVPIGLSVVDLIAGCHLDEAVAAALYNRARSGEGAHIKVTMLGSAMDLQSDFVTAHRWGGGDSGYVANDHLCSGIFRCADGYIAISSCPIEAVVAPFEVDDKISAHERGEKIRECVAKESCDYWIERLEQLPKAQCCRVQSWQELFASPQGASLEMLQSVTRSSGFKYVTTRCPVRFDDQIVRYDLGAPYVGEYTEYVTKKYKLYNKPKTI